MVQVYELIDVIVRPHLETFGVYLGDTSKRRKELESFQKGWIWSYEVIRIPKISKIMYSKDHYYRFQLFFQMSLSTNNMSLPHPTILCRYSRLGSIRFSFFLIGPEKKKVWNANRHLLNIYIYIYSHSVSIFNIIPLLLS